MIAKNIIICIKWKLVNCLYVIFDLLLFENHRIYTKVSEAMLVHQLVNLQKTIIANKQDIRGKLVVCEASSFSTLAVELGNYLPGRFSQTLGTRKWARAVAYIFCTTVQVFTCNTLFHFVGMQKLG